MNSIQNYLTIIVLSAVMLPLMLRAGDDDTIRVRLTSGAKLKGVIRAAEVSGVTIDLPGIGETRFRWNEITFLSSAAVYDSLTSERSFIVLPPPVSAGFELGKHFTANLFVGKGIIDMNGIGFGGQVQYLVDPFFAGLLLNIHLKGDNDGGGSIVYYGPQAGLTFMIGPVSVRPMLTYGEAKYTTKGLYNNRDVTSWALSPGVSLAMDAGNFRIGLHYRYFDIPQNKYSVLYLVFGQ